VKESLPLPATAKGEGIGFTRKAIALSTAIAALIRLAGARHLLPLPGEGGTTLTTTQKNLSPFLKPTLLCLIPKKGEGSYGQYD
jgi:hypothetical protein